MSLAACDRSEEAEIEASPQPHSQDTQRDIDSHQSEIDEIESECRQILRAYKLINQKLRTDIKDLNDLIARMPA